MIFVNGNFSNFFTRLKATLKILALFSNFVQKSVTLFSVSVLLNLGHCYIKICSVSLLLVALKCGMRLLYIIYYFRDNIFFRMLESMSVVSLICDNFQKIHFFINGSYKLKNLLLKVEKVLTFTSLPVFNIVIISKLENNNYKCALFLIIIQNEYWTKY